MHCSVTAPGCQSGAFAADLSHHVQHRGHLLHSYHFRNSSLGLKIDWKTHNHFSSHLVFPNYMRVRDNRPLTNILTFKIHSSSLISRDLMRISTFPCWRTNPSLADAGRTGPLPSQSAGDWGWKANIQRKSDVSNFDFSLSWLSPHSSQIWNSQSRGY